MTQEQKIIRAKAGLADIAELVGQFQQPELARAPLVLLRNRLNLRRAQRMT